MKAPKASLDILFCKILPMKDEKNPAQQNGTLFLRGTNRPCYCLTWQTLPEFHSF
jgi:hypothetical protein